MIKYDQATLEETFCSLLKPDNSEIILLGALDVMEVYLSEKYKLGAAEYKDAIETLDNFGCIDALENLQTHSSDKVYNKVAAILMKYFSAAQVGFVQTLTPTDLVQNLIPIDRDNKEWITIDFPEGVDVKDLTNELTEEYPEVEWAWLVYESEVVPRKTYVKVPAEIEDEFLETLEKLGIVHHV